MLISTLFGIDAPTMVDAAEIDVQSKTVYLLHENLLHVFSYTEISDEELSYAFVKKVDITSNVPDNPFMAGPVSSLSRAPNNIDAMWLYDEGLGVIVSHWVYYYVTVNQTWEYAGKVIC